MKYLKPILAKAEMPPEQMMRQYKGECESFIVHIVCFRASPDRPVKGTCHSLECNTVYKSLWMLTNGLQLLYCFALLSGAIFHAFVVSLTLWGCPASSVLFIGSSRSTVNCKMYPRFLHRPEFFS